MFLPELKNISLEGLSFLTKRQVSLLKKLDVENVYDLITFFPYRYEDRSVIESIETSFLQKRPVCIIATVVEHQSIFYNNTKHPKIIIQDSKMRASLVGFNRQFLFQQLKVGKKYWIYAEFSFKFNELQTSNFDFEEYNENQPPKNFGKIFPVYPLTEGLTLKELRSIISKVISKYIDLIDDELPPYLIKAHNLFSKKEALINIHSPEDEKKLKKARLRLAFEELFAIQLAVLMKRKHQSNLLKNSRYTKETLLNKFLNSLPFQLTQSQNKALNEIISSMKSNIPLHRLLQGDVGSGKTVVAFAAMVFAAENGIQSAMIVPTEVLAYQHLSNFKKLAANLEIEIEVLTKSTPDKEREKIIESLSNGNLKIVIGTHSLIQPDVNFKNLGFIIFDEQHRFGVEQRILLAKKGDNPDILVMTATPIPRTLSLTLYGDLDISIIDEMPSGRKPIITKWFRKDKDYPQLLNFVRSEIEKGRQAYFVYPLIDESDRLEVENAIKNYEKLKNYFKDFKVGLLHGKINTEEKLKIMNDFKENKINILVSTSVIEVGIDVENATVMVIEGAERFGLSQLHQLRGRVGRGKEQSYCALVTNGDESEDTKKRMEIICKYNDGFKIAEEDLKLRGPGEILGVKQSGMPDLKILDYLINEKLLLVARKDVENILDFDPWLTKPVHRTLKEGIINFLPSDYLRSG
jgi:ATP-dependent DNA helicase RecG